MTVGDEETIVNAARVVSLLLLLLHVVVSAAAASVVVRWQSIDGRGLHGPGGPSARPERAGP